MEPQKIDSNKFHGEFRIKLKKSYSVHLNKSILKSRTSLMYKGSIQKNVLWILSFTLWTS